MKANRVVLSLLSASMLGIVSSATGQAAVATDPCAKADTENAIDACTSDEVDRADKKLNLVYGEIKRALTTLSQEGATQDERDQAKAGAENLRLAQKAWIAFRDSYCDAL